MFMDAFHSMLKASASRICAKKESNWRFLSVSGPFIPYIFWNNKIPGRISSFNRQYMLQKNRINPAIGRFPGRAGGGKGMPVIYR